VVGFAKTLPIAIAPLSNNDKPAWVHGVMLAKVMPYCQFWGCDVICWESNMLLMGAK